MLMLDFLPVRPPMIVLLDHVLSRPLASLDLAQVEDEGLECQSAREASMFTVEQVMKERQTVWLEPSDLGHRCRERNGVV